MDLLRPKEAASFRHDQCVLPSPGFCCTRRITRACTVGVAARGLLPLCRPCNPAMPDCSNRRFHTETVALGLTGFWIPTQWAGGLLLLAVVASAYYKYRVATFLEELLR